MSDEEMQQKRDKSKLRMLVIAILAVIILAIVIGVIIYQRPSNRLARALNLGHKYLTEEQWEEAKVEFDKAIKLDPMNVEAYLGMAQAYEGMNDIEGAIAVLENGYELTKAEEINKKLQELKLKLVLGDFHALGNLGEYDAYGHANNGILIVGKDNLYGAVDYNNNIIVPLKYAHSCDAANDAGQIWFGDENGYYVFDESGAVIFETENPIRAVSEGVVLCCGLNGTDYIVEYVTLEQEVLYSHVVPDYEEDGDIVSCVGMNEGKAFAYMEDYSEDTTEYVEIRSDGTVEDVYDRYRQINREEGGGFIATSGSFAGWPIGPVNNGYFVSRIFDEVYVTSAETEEYNGVIGTLVYSGEENYDSWRIDGYYKNGVFVCNNGTLCSICLSKGETDTYILSDVWMGDAHNRPDNNKIIGEYDSLGINDENLWLISKDGKWGYIDHSGEVIAMFDDAAAFSNGKALVVEDGIAYQIDENMNKLNAGCSADQVVCYGDIWSIEKDGKLYFVQ